MNNNSNSYNQINADEQTSQAEIHDDSVVRVLVADDEKMMRNLLTLSLERLGYEVVATESGPEAIALFDQQSFDLIMLDVVMPEMDGFEVCQELRKRTDVPIVMLTALNRPDDIVQGLEMGADNYITKPFTFKEVEARIRALLRRTIRSASKPAFTVLEKGDVRLNTETREVVVAGQASELTKTEYSLLNYLMLHADQPMSKQNLLERVWGYESIDSVNLVELAVRRLRKKIEENPSKPRRLKTVRGVGYKFCAASANRAFKNSSQSAKRPILSQPSITMAHIGHSPTEMMATA